MARVDRFPWLRRDGAPLALSLVLHVAALLLIAPWLVMRTIPAPPVGVEVLLEPAEPEPPTARPERAVRLRDLVRVERAPAQSLRPKLARVEALQPQPQQSTTAVVKLPTPQAPVAHVEQGDSGRSAPAPRETAGLSAPQGGSARSAAVEASSGPAALARGSAEPSPLAPSTPSAGSTPQPSARAAAAPAQPGEDRDDGPLKLAGPSSQVMSAEPEFRNAARQGGQASLRGASRAPEDGLARQPGALNQTALTAARAVPQAVPAGSGGSPGGTAAALAPPPRQGAGSSGSAAREGVATPASALAAAPLAGPGAGVGSTPASRTPAGSGLSTAGLGSGSRTVSPGERASGLLAAAAPTAAGPGAALAGTGPGASEAGSGRGQQVAGAGSVPRDAAASLLSAGGREPAAARGDAQTSGAQLSGAGETAGKAEPAREASARVLQTQQPSGEAKVVPERFSAATIAVDSPRSVCELPLMFAGFDRKPIPRGLDTINATELLRGETPPRHHPGNQAPRYPLQALPLRAEGRTLVRAEVRADGSVGQLLIKQTSGFQALDAAALETVRSWRFQPAQRNGAPVVMWMDVPIEYKLPQAQGVYR